MCNLEFTKLSAESNRVKEEKYKRVMKIFLYSIVMHKRKRQWLVLT